MKLRSDMLFLLMLRKPSRKFIVLTDDTMHKACLRQAAAGRTPTEIEFLWAELPSELEVRLAAARKRASNEVTPQMLEAEIPDEVLLANEGVDGSEIA